MGGPQFLCAKWEGKTKGQLWVVARKLYGRFTRAGGARCHASDTETKPGSDVPLGGEVR